MDYGPCKDFVGAVINNWPEQISCQTFLQNYILGIALSRDILSIRKRSRTSFFFSGIASLCLGVLMDQAQAIWDGLEP